MAERGDMEVDTDHQLKTTSTTLGELQLRLLDCEKRIKNQNRTGHTSITNLNCQQVPAEEKDQRTESTMALKSVEALHLKMVECERRLSQLYGECLLSIRNLKCQQFAGKEKDPPQQSPVKLEELKAVKLELEEYYGLLKVIMEEIELVKTEPNLERPESEEDRSQFGRSFFVEFSLFMLLQATLGFIHCISVYLSGQTPLSKELVFHGYTLMACMGLALALLAVSNIVR